MSPTEVIYENYVEKIHKVLITAEEDSNRWLPIESLGIIKNLFIAMLTTRTALQELDKKKFVYYKTVFQRFMRITPVLALVILFNMSLAYALFNESSSTLLEFSVQKCQKYWWSTLLHLQVYTNPHKLCMHTTWYLSVDFQMTILVAPILVYLLWKYGQNVIILIIGLILMSSVYVYQKAIESNIIVKQNDFLDDFNGEFMTTFYYPTHVRGIVYLIGIILGYCLHMKNEICMPKSKIFQSSFVISVLIIIMGPTFISYIYDLLGENIALNALFFTSVRIIWGTATALIIFVCQIGNGGVINEILSKKFWIPFGKIGLSFYLAHPVLQYNIISFNNNEYNIESISMMTIYIAQDIFLALLVSVTFYLTVEEPFYLIGKLISEKFIVKEKFKEF
ncbi:CLUMA_CG006713, isoform A [Clunio marinus]|uniref:CLUMA_CG006713, isoform A n=1 Tax=Clunio marinus TaxID=568069 RepID=A0A1J1HYF1_9DIPT|nr:CLUMA_CG006713, isoform A [Clunio marinus]